MIRKVVVNLRNFYLKRKSFKLVVGMWNLKSWIILDRIFYFWIIDLNLVDVMLLGIKSDYYSVWCEIR